MMVGKPKVIYVDSFGMPVASDVANTLSRMYEYIQ